MLHILCVDPIAERCSKWMLTMRNRNCNRGAKNRGRRRKRVRQMLHQAKLFKCLTMLHSVSLAARTKQNKNQMHLQLCWCRRCRCRHQHHCTARSCFSASFVRRQCIFHSNHSSLRANLFAVQMFTANGISASAQVSLCNVPHKMSSWFTNTFFSTSMQCAVSLARTARCLAMGDLYMRIKREWNRRNEVKINRNNWIKPEI